LFSLMPSDDRQAAYVQLLRDCIRTFEELDVVLVLARTGDRRWTIPDIASETGMADTAVETTVRGLENAGLLVGGVTGYQLDRDNPRHALGVEELLAAYDRNRHAVFSQMSANAVTRVRTSALRAFANAFLLGRRDDG
jgi:hypothetical protein